MIRLSILNTGKTPIYRQLYEQITAQILRGDLLPDTPLPPIRTVAKELGISVITVRNAWDALEADGYVKTVKGSGCYVLPRLSRTESATDEVLEAALLTAARRARETGVSADVLSERLRTIFRGI